MPGHGKRQQKGAIQMARKNVVITINHPPYAGNFCQEGLRAVVGTHLALEQQEIITVFLGDGVFLALKDLKQDDFLKYLKTLKAMKMSFVLEEESLTDRKIAKESLFEDFIALPRKDIMELLQDADHVIAY
jgi:sulfur relay (sulfurtransferase) DsrF/TusC family protein